jgi:hypothetical protein
MSKHKIQGALNTVKADVAQKAYEAGHVVESTNADPALRGTHSTGLDRALQECTQVQAEITNWVAINCDTKSGKIIDWVVDDNKAASSTRTDGTWAKLKREKFVEMVKHHRNANFGEAGKHTGKLEFFGVNSHAVYHTGEARNRLTGQVETFVAQWVMDDGLPELNFDGRSAGYSMYRLCFFHYVKETANIEQLEELFIDAGRIAGSLSDHREIENGKDYDNPENSDNEY